MHQNLLINLGIKLADEANSGMRKIWFLPNILLPSPLGPDVEITKHVILYTVLESCIIQSNLFFYS